MRSNKVAVWVLSCLLLVSAKSQTAILSTSQIVKRESGTVVLIEVLDKEKRVVAQGSGVVMTSDGIIASNFHVFDGACDVSIRSTQATDKMLVTHFIASDPKRDLILVRVRATGLKSVTRGRSDKLSVGDRVVAIGNPLGLEHSVSEGILSGVRHDESGPILQITAPISPGSSGGGLFSTTGALVGITTFTMTRSQNLNFAMPVEDVTRLMRRPFQEPELAWERVVLTLCHEPNAPEWSDTGVLSTLVDKNFFDSAVQGFLKGMNHGSLPKPHVFIEPARTANGHQFPIREWRTYAYATIGISITVLNDVVSYISLEGSWWSEMSHLAKSGEHSEVEPPEKWSSFKGTLPLGLGWHDKRSSIQDRLGEPNFIDGGLSLYRVGATEYTLIFCHDDQLCRLDISNVK